MVKITNGVDVFEVSQGAFETIYRPQGFMPLVKPVMVEVVEEVLEDISLDEEFCIDLLTKPLGGWNKDQVKRFCEIKSIDITGTKNANEAKARIKEFLDEEEKALLA